MSEGLVTSDVAYLEEMAERAKRGMHAVSREWLLSFAARISQSLARVIELEAHCKELEADFFLLQQERNGINEALRAANQALADEQKLREAAEAERDRMRGLLRKWRHGGGRDAGEAMRLIADTDAFLAAGKQEGK